MRLYLVQHGEALGKEIDPERPLSESGRDDVARVARFLATAGVRVGAVLHSGKLRAEQTANILASGLADERDGEARAGLDPNDPTEPLVREIAAFEQETMLVGHLPQMARLAARLVAGRDEPPVVAFTPGTVVCLEPANGQGFVIAWMVRPELIPRA